MENIWNLKKKTLVVGIFQQLYIEKALYIHFQEEKRKKERKKKERKSPKLKHQPYTLLNTYIHTHTKTQKSEKK